MTFANCVQEFPNIRFRAAKPGEDASSGLEARSLVAQRVAVDLNERLSVMQRSGQLPASSTCDLIIFDRCDMFMAPLARFSDHFCPYTFALAL